MKLTKKKRLEKAKVKLKAKKLPKGQNVTDTSFKARKIILPSQLKDPQPGDIVSKNQQNIPVLISHLDHHRPQMRFLGLQGLKEIIVTHEPHQLAMNLPKIFESLASMILDLDSKIRKSALDALQILISKVPKEMLKPHFQAMRVYMTAAMTHINPFVQKDSLRMLDLMLNEAADLMKEHVNTFLPTFLDLVSKKTNLPNSERTLFDVFNKKVSNLQWREMVLGRLTKYFCLLIEQKQRDELTSYSAVSRQFQSKTSTVIHWNGDTPLYIAEQLSFIQGICHLGIIFEQYTHNFGGTESDEKVLMNHIDCVMPILFDSWREVAPSIKDKKNAHVINGQSAVTLQFVLETIICIWKCLEDMEEVSGKICFLTAWFREKYKQKIIKYFISIFPFVNDDVCKHDPGDELPEFEKMLPLNTVPVSSKCIEQNLQICYLVECLDCCSDPNIIANVLQCLEACMKHWEGKKGIPTLLKVLNAILKSDKSAWPKAKLLGAIMEGLRVKSLEEEMKLILVDIVCVYVTVEGVFGNAGMKQVDKWLSEMPSYLLQPVIPMKMILALRRLAAQRMELFLLSLKKKSRSIAENIFLGKISGVDSQVEGQKAIIDILFYTEDLYLYTFLQRLAVEHGNNEELISFIDDRKEFYLYLRKTVSD